MSQDKESRPQLDRGNISIVNAGMLFFTLLGLALIYQHQTDLQERTNSLIVDVKSTVDGHTKILNDANNRRLVSYPTRWDTTDEYYAWEKAGEKNPGLKPPDVWQIRKDYPPPVPMESK